MFLISIRPKECVLKQSKKTHVPDHLRTQEMCIKATEKNPCVMPHVPDHLKTQECVKMWCGGTRLH